MTDYEITYSKQENRDGEPVHHLQCTCGDAIECAEKTQLDKLHVMHEKKHQVAGSTGDS